MNNKIYRTCLVLFLLSYCLKSTAINYYVSIYGSDNSNGLSTTTAWQSMKKVNSQRYFGGDTIFFKRGDAWREGEALYILCNGDINNPIVYSAYGKGAKPQILASEDVSSKNKWKLKSKNIWVTNSKINITTIDLPNYSKRNPDIANLIFDNEKSIGNKKRYIPQLKEQGDFCLNTKDTLLYLYSIKNPSRYYTKIEATGIRNCENNIVMWNKSNIIIRDLDIRYSKNNGIILIQCNNVLIDNCDFSWIGGCYYTTQTNMLDSVMSPARMGNGVQLWNGNSNITITHCAFNQVYDAGISPQGLGEGYELKNIKIHHNLIKNCFYSFEFWGSDSRSKCDSVFFENNTCINAGFGWSTKQRPNKGGSAHLKLNLFRIKLSNVYIRNNIFYEAADFFIESIPNTSKMLATFDIDYNCYFNSNDKKSFVRWLKSVNSVQKSSVDNSEVYSRETQNDLHSIFGNPMFDKNYFLMKNSPVIDKGKNVGLPFYGSAPDMGAFEYSEP